MAATVDTEVILGSLTLEEKASPFAGATFREPVAIPEKGVPSIKSYSEDPFLTGKLASSMIIGVETEGVAASVNHLVANEQGTERRSVDETISERALREISLRPFEIAVKDCRKLLSNKDLPFAIGPSARITPLPDFIQRGPSGTIFGIYGPRQP
ncbi:glycosyl hydrolase family 3 N terminal domain-containing protein [Aspergillus carlsbadensis]|nr:glycosyl hydrolase family 3 N terminal domain-containing protein [Aspergillus carlsbadensis]